MRKPYTVGITGGSGSGKSHFVKGLTALFKETEICLISMDHYYKPRDQQIIDNDGYKNFDLPSSINREAFIADIKTLKNGNQGEKEEYTFNNPAVKSKVLTFKPAPILIIEGLFVQYFSEVEEELDLKIFIEAKDHLKLGRRIKRDKEERGYDLADVLYRYEHHTMPVYEQLIAPFMHSADIIIPNNSDFKAATLVLAEFLRSQI